MIKFIAKDPKKWVILKNKNEIATLDLATSTITNRFSVLTDFVENLSTYFPEYNGNGYELMGFGWFQGYNDGLNDASIDAYEENQVNLINDLRKDYESDELPFVNANTGSPGYDPWWANASWTEKNKVLLVKKSRLLDFLIKNDVVPEVISLDLIKKNYRGEKITLKKPRER